MTARELWTDWSAAFASIGEWAKRSAPAAGKWGGLVVLAWLAAVGLLWSAAPDAPPEELAQAGGLLASFLFMLYALERSL